MEGISSLTKSIKPPPCVVLSSFYGGVNPSKINWFRGNVLFNFVSDISKVSILLLTTSFSISNLFFIELIFKWAIMIRFGFFLRISFNASFFSNSSELVPFSWFMPDLSDFSVYPKLAKNLKFTSLSKLEALWKLPVTRQVLTTFLILLIKLIVSLPNPLGFKCNPPLLSLLEVIFRLSMTSICKPCKCSVALITVKEAFLDGSLTVLLVPTCNIILSGHFF